MQCDAIMRDPLHESNIVPKAFPFDIWRGGKREALETRLFMNQNKKVFLELILDVMCTGSQSRLK